MPQDTHDSSSPNESAESEKPTDGADAAESASKGAAAKPAESPASVSTTGSSGDTATRSSKKKKGKSASASDSAPPPASTSDSPAPPTASGTEEFLFPRVPTFKPAAIKLRDLLITGVATIGLALLMWQHGDVINPRGEDPAHPLSHYQSLIHSGHVPGGVIIGIVLVALIVLGLFGILGDSPLDLRGDEATPPSEDPKLPYAPRANGLGYGAIAALVLVGGARIALRASHLTGGTRLLFGLAILALAAGGARTVLNALGATKLARTLWQHEGTWLVTFCVLLYVPLAGAYGLWDPWETHYSEVAREILARDDWITLWWGQEGWFMSKPILIFWMAALGMGFGSAFGLTFWRDMGPGSHEWFIRIPIVFLAIAAVYAVYRAVSTAWGRRAGLLCGMVLATMPHWCFLAHQAMTDMPFVAPLVIAMSFLMMAVVADPEKMVGARAVTLFGRTFRVSFWHLAVGLILAVAVPQVLYLLTRPVLLSCPEDADHSCQAVLTASRIGGAIQFPIERYWSGSAGNSAYHDVAATVPGSPAWEDRYNQVAFFPSFVQGLIWVAIGTLLMLGFRRERRHQSLNFSMVYLFGAISFMGKGPAGLFIPEIVLLGYMITTGRWKILPRIRFLQLVGIYLLCGFPWYIGIYCRLGNEFFDRFVVHDLLNRAFAGVHGDTGTFRYFVWQLGYSMFPWTGLVPAALVGWKLFIPEHATVRQKDIARLCLLWFLVTFTLFSLMVTKFHHYIFPAVPSAALLVGLLLHRMLGEKRLEHSPRSFGAIAALFAGVAMLVIGVANFFGAWHGEVSHEAPFRLPPGNTAMGVILVLFGLAALVLGWWLSSRAEELIEVDPALRTATETDGELRVEVVGEALAKDSGYMARYGAVGLGAVGIGAAVLLALIGRDIGMVGSSRPAGFERFIHLFIYNYDRPFPTRSYDYHPILIAFGLVSVAIAALLAVTRMRRHATRMMIALAACFSFWALDKYMMDLSNHWSQRNLFERYYSTRGTRSTLGMGEDARYWADPIAAYQMNWKGENFYTGNHAAMLECGLPLCHERTPEWLQRHHGQRVFFVTEHSRSGSIISQVRQLQHGADAHTVTDEYDNNKFVLVEGQL